MKTFIKQYDLENIKKKFILLYILNVTDIIFTVLLLQTGYFAEVNLLMVKALQSPVTSVILKIFLPAVLLYIMYHRIKQADRSQLKVSNIALLISISIYSLVNLSHLVWVAMLPVLMRII